MDTFSRYDRARLRVAAREAAPHRMLLQRFPDIRTLSAGWRCRRTPAVLAVLCLLVATGCDPVIGGGSQPSPIVTGSGQASPTVTGSGEPSPVGDPPGATELEPLPTGSAGTMIAVGDSFGSGEGSPEVLWEWNTDGDIPKHHWAQKKAYLDGTNTDDNQCHRSVNAAAFEAAKSLQMTLKFADCSGATTRDYQKKSEKWSGEPAQRSVLVDHGKKATLVAVSFGGNDVNFGGVAKACAVLKQVRVNRAKPASCRPQIAEAAELLPELDKKLLATLKDIDSLAPDARIIVQGYPRLFPAEPKDSCPTGFPRTWFSTAEQQDLNEFVTDLNRRIRAAAATVGADYIDIYDLFEEHDLCVDDDLKRWVNRLHKPFSKTTAESFHPTIAGQEAIAGKIIACYTVPSSCATDSDGENWYGWYGYLSTESLVRANDQRVVLQVRGKEGSRTGTVMFPDAGCGNKLTEKLQEGSLVLFDSVVLFGKGRCEDIEITLNFKGDAIIYRAGTFSGTLVQVPDQKTVDLEPGAWRGEASPPGETAGSKYVLKVDGSQPPQITFGFPDVPCSGVLEQVARIDNMSAFTQVSGPLRGEEAHCPYRSTLILGAGRRVGQMNTLRTGEWEIAHWLAVADETLLLGKVRKE